MGGAGTGRIRYLFGWVSPANIGGMVARRGWLAVAKGLPGRVVAKASCLAGLKARTFGWLDLSRSYPGFNRTILSRATPDDFGSAGQRSILQHRGQHRPYRCD